MWFSGQKSVWKFYFENSGWKKWPYRSTGIASPSFPNWRCIARNAVFSVPIQDTWWGVLLKRMEFITKGTCLKHCDCFILKYIFWNTWHILWNLSKIDNLCCTLKKVLPFIYKVNMKSNNYVFHKMTNK